MTSPPESSTTSTPAPRTAAAYAAVPVRATPRPVAPVPVVPARRGDTARGVLPSWPLAWFFAGLPVWWFLGLIDVIVVPAGLVMALYLGRAGKIRIPRVFGLWALFLFFMVGSAIELTKFTSMLTYGYRASIYLGCTAVFLYVYNAWRSISDRQILGYLAWYLLTMTVGGLLGAVMPRHQFTTPAYYALRQVSPFLASNELVKSMVVRPFSQYDPTNFFHIPPRPAAPFLFTNNWGNAYSLLLPLLVVLAFQVPRHTWRRKGLLLLIPVSLVPAMLTLNRGMFIGLALVGLIIGLRMAARGYLGRVLLALVVAGGIGLFLWNALNVSAGLQTRVEASTDTRASLYQQSLHVVTGSPVFGFGVTIQSTTTGSIYDPKVGTQGQFWMVLVSHGMIAVAAFTLFFLLSSALSFRRRDLPGMVYSALLLAGTVETLYYGLVPYGLPLMMVIAALALRPRVRPQAASDPERQETSAADSS